MQWEGKGRSSALQSKESEEGLWIKQRGAIPQVRNTIDKSISPNEPNIVRVLMENCTALDGTMQLTTFLKHIKAKKYKGRAGQKQNK